jgi:hypothetical protein
MNREITLKNKKNIKISTTMPNLDMVSTSASVNQLIL